MTATTTAPAAGYGADLIDGVYAYVRTAPPLTLTIDGHTATISGVRFVWHARCGWCRLATPLWTDGGTIELGLKVTAGRRGSSPRAEWFTRYQPAAAPVPPADCSNSGCRRPSDAGWLVDRWALDARPGVLGVDRVPMGPAQPNLCALQDQAWLTFRREYPDLAVAADAAFRRRLDRRSRMTQGSALI